MFNIKCKYEMNSTFKMFRTYRACYIELPFLSKLSIAKVLYVFTKQSKMEKYAA